MIIHQLERYKNILIPIISNVVPNAKIIVYGSRARGDYKEGSDIDIALDNGEKIDDALMAKIIGDIEESNLPICYDVVDFRAVSEKLRQAIMNDGVVWKE